MRRLRTHVAIIGGGPAGLLLSQILHRHQVDSVVLEKHSREHVLRRIRAGLLEWGTVEVLRDAGVGERMDREGQLHDGSMIVWAGKHRCLIDTKKFTGKPMMAYGQTAITEDLYAARDAMGGVIVDNARDVRLHDIASDAPVVTYQKDGEEVRVECDFIAGCDGFHGVSRQAIPGDVLEVFEKVYPFGWLGIMSETPPLDDIIYANHPDGFALASQRKSDLSRYYVQCEVDADLDDWPDERFWETLKARFPDDISNQIVTGPSIEKSIAPLRSFVAEPMQHGRLFLAGDAAHIVPPTGAKGLNLAVSDVHYLSLALIAHYRNGDDALMAGYSATALKRVWGAERLSWYLTNLLHRFPDQGPLDLRMQEDELNYIASSEAAMRSLAEQYVGLPL